MSWVEVSVDWKVGYWVVERVDQTVVMMDIVMVVTWVVRLVASWALMMVVDSVAWKVDLMVGT